MVEGNKHTHTHTHMLQINETIWHKIFAEQVLLNTEIFSRLDLKHDDKFFPYKFLEGFVKIGHELADIIIDSTEFKLQQPSNYDLNTLTFSNCK